MGKAAPVLLSHRVHEVSILAVDQPGVVNARLGARLGLGHYDLHRSVVAMVVYHTRLELSVDDYPGCLVGPATRDGEELHRQDLDELVGSVAA